MAPTLCILWPPSLGPGPSFRPSPGEEGVGGEEATCFLFGSFSLCGHLLLSLVSSCHLSVYSSPAFFWVLSLCVSLGPLHPCLSWIQGRGGQYLSAGPAIIHSPSPSRSLPLPPFFPVKKWEGVYPEALLTSPHSFFFLLLLRIRMWLCLFSCCLNLAHPAPSLLPQFSVFEGGEVGEDL